MAAACKALPRCTRAYSAVIDRQATLSYECVEFTRNRRQHAYRHALVKLFITGQSSPMSMDGYWRTDFLLRHSIEDPWQPCWTSTSHFELTRSR